LLRLAGRHPGHRRRTHPHALAHLPRRLPDPRGRGHRPLRSHDLRPLRRGLLHLQGPRGTGGRHHHARGRRHRGPGRGRGHQVHQGLRHPRRLRSGRHRLSHLGLLEAPADLRARHRRGLQRHRHLHDPRPGLGPGPLHHPQDGRRRQARTRPQEGQVGVSPARSAPCIPDSSPSPPPPCSSPGS